MSVPDPRRDDACQYAREIAHRFANIETLAVAVNEAKGLAWTRDALRNAYDRFRKSSGAPKLIDLLGAGPASDFDDEKTWPGVIPVRTDDAVDHVPVKIDISLDPGAFGMRPDAYKLDIHATPIPTARGIIGEAKARVASVTSTAAADVIVDSHPFRLPKETTRKKLPTPSDRVIPYDWTEAPPRRMIVESDNHYCHEDKRFQAVKFEFASRRGCDALFNLGDQHDFTNLSRFDKDPAYANTMWDDIRSSNERHWKPATQIFKRIEFLEGNHDWRIYKAIMANHALFGLPSLMDWHSLGVPEEVVCHTYGTHRQIGHVWGEHGDQVRGQNPTHYAMLHRGGRVTAFGHTHKPGCYIRVLRSETGKMTRREVYNLGHGQDESTCDLWAGTVKGWSHSFLYVEHYEREDGWDVNVYPIHTDRGVFSFDGVVYRG